MTSLALAWRTAQRYRARTVLAIIGVAVIGALLFGMLLLSRGLLLSFADLLNSAGFDVRVVGSLSVPSLRLPITGSTSLADDIRRLPEVERVALIRLESATVRIAGGPLRNITLVGTTDVGEDAWTLVKGVNLKSTGAQADRCALVIAQPLASALAIGPDARLTLNARPPGVVSDQVTTRSWRFPGRPVTLPALRPLRLVAAARGRCASGSSVSRRRPR